MSRAVSLKIDETQANAESQPLFEIKWFTTEQAATYLGIPIGSLRNLTSQGKIPYYKLTGTKLNRYLKTELDELLLQSKRGGSYGL